MKQLAISALLVFVGFAGWRAGGVLSTDAMSMAVGIVFGVLASLPAALLILAAARRQTQPQPPTDARSQQMADPGSMPIVVVTPQAYPGFGAQLGAQYPQLTNQQSALWSYPPQSARPQRAFTIVGEQAEYMDDF